MALAADVLLDRIKLKTQISRWRAAALAVGTLLLVLMFGNSLNSIPNTPIGGDYIARISIEDIIIEDTVRDEHLRTLEEDNKAKAVLVYINSPGGTIVGGETLYKRLRQIAEKKPVVAVLGSVAASGGYMVALAADRIFTHEGTITGSIGVLLQSAEITELAKKVGVNFITFKSGELKASPSPFEKVTPEVEKAINATIQDSYRLFLDMVEARRPLNRSEIEKLADGRVYTGRQALKNKLVDAIGGEDEAITWLEGEKKIEKGIPVKEYVLKPEKARIEKLLDSFSYVKNPLAEVLPSSGMMALWKPGVF